MKTCWQCIGCIFLIHLCLLAWADDVLPPPGAPLAENISSDGVRDDAAPEGEGDDPVRNLEPSVEVSASFADKKQGDTFSKQLFAEATSQNSGVANEITTSGQPVVVTLTDGATAELQQRAAIIPSQQQQQPSTAIEQGGNNNHTEPSSSGSRSKSADLLHQEAVSNQSSVVEEEQAATTTNSSVVVDNTLLKTKEENLTTEEIPSFSEWAQKQLEQAEKNKEPLNASTHQHQANNGSGKQAKLRWKNYASLDCGAKVVASNPEAVSPSAILSPSRDEYKLNTCSTSRIWFIVELCEAIQAKKIDLANFELFSSSPKDLVVSVSDRFPTREWSNVGHFTAKDERDVQSFDLHPHLFGKYIKVEVKSHYGAEHYCPISLFRVYGTSEFEVLQKEDPVHADRLEQEEEDDDDDGDESLDFEHRHRNGDGSKNLFSSATDAVISMVKKAAEVLGNNKGNHSNQTEPVNTTSSSVKVGPLVRACTCPSHLVVCVNCTDLLFGEVYELLSCSSRQIGHLVDAVKEALVGSNVCTRFGLEFVKGRGAEEQGRRSFVRAFFPDRYLGAMCNTVAILYNKVVLNVSSSYTNLTETASDEEKIVYIETSEPHVAVVDLVTDELVLESVTDTATVTKSTCSTDVSQIKPTKTLASELHLVVSESDLMEDGSRVVTPPATVTETVQPNSTVEEAEPAAAAAAEVVVVVDDSVEEDPLEHLISELNGPQATTTSTTPQAQKESVFLRLSNRIKALERNMSLSGQYLEELSKRYKKQVEEIQKLLDKTILHNSEEGKRKEEQNRHLEERLVVLTAAVEALLAEKRSWSSTLYCVIVSSLVTLFIVSFCSGKVSDSRPAPTSSTRFPDAVEVKRRKSIDVVTHSEPQKKRRRPSDQALKIVRSSTEAGGNDSQRRRKKKRHLVLVRSNSIGEVAAAAAAVPVVLSTPQPPPPPSTAAADWVEAKHIEEIPFALEESEHSSLEPMATLSEGVRIAAPHFLKTAATSRSVRGVGGVVVVNNGVGGGVGGVRRKAASVDESGRRKSPSPAPSVNGSVSLGETTPKKERRGLKKILKKVF